MADQYKLIHAGVVVFKVLAWVSLLIQGALGIYLLITGGPDVPVGGVDVPARIIGILNLVAAGIYFFILLLVSAVLKLLLDLRSRTATGA